MSATNELSPGTGSPLRTSVPLATRAPTRASITPSNMPPRLSAKLNASATPPLSTPPPPMTNFTASSGSEGVSSETLFGDSTMDYRNNLLNYGLQVGLQTIPAIAMGLIIDKVLKKLQDRFEVNPLLMIIIQVIVIVVILFIVEKYIATNYADAWQLTTPGFFFPAFFFGVQFNLFENIKKLKEMVFDNK